MNWAPASFSTTSPQGSVGALTCPHSGLLRCEPGHRPANDRPLSLAPFLWWPAYTSACSPVMGMASDARLLYLGAALDGPQERHPRAMIILLVTIAVALICCLAFVNR